MKNIFPKIIIAFLCIGLLGVIYSFFIEPNQLVTREYQLTFNNIRATPYKGMRIVLIADLHAGSPFIDEAKIDRVVAMANAAKPDLTLLLGDYIVQGVIGGTYMPPEIIVPHLQKLQAPLGVFAVLGNHDWWGDHEHIRETFNNAGIRILENENVPLMFRGKKIYLAGIGDFMFVDALKGGQLATKNIPPDEGALCMTHEPDTFPLLPKTCFLTVVGHTHGGQVDVPLLGRIVNPSRLKRFVLGRYQEDGKDLFVTPGIGTSILPVRFNTPPEVTVITLQ